MRSAEIALPRDAKILTQLTCMARRLPLFLKLPVTVWWKRANRHRRGGHSAGCFDSIGPSIRSQSAIHVGS